MAVRPTPVGQRIQPRFARGEERNKITVQKIVKLLRCIVRQQDARALLVGRHPKQRVLPADLGDEVVPNPICREKGSLFPYTETIPQHSRRLH